MTSSVRRSALITGATGGLGREICLKLAADGWDIYVGWHRSEDIAKAVCAELTALGIQARTLKLDMNDAPAISGAVDFDPVSPVEVLVINAARLPQVAPLGQVSLEEVREQFNVSALGPFELIRSVWRRHFKPRGKGHLIVISTAGVALPPAPRMAGYIIGKAALEAVAACATSEFGPGGLATTVIRPTYMDTPLLRAFENRYVEFMRERNCVIPPAQVALVVAAAANNPPVAGEYNCREAKGN